MEERRDFGKIKPTIKQAVLWTVAAWKDVSVTTIANCFQHTKILPPEWNTCTDCSDSYSRTNHIAAGEEMTAIPLFSLSFMH